MQRVATTAKSWDFQHFSLNHVLDAIVQQFGQHLNRGGNLFFKAGHQSSEINDLGCPKCLSHG
jgi:hypothetical protein